MTVIKICGFTQLDDAMAAVDAGADLLGFILVRSSPRYIAPERAADIIAGLRQHGVTAPCVGVVANLPLQRVRSLKQQCGFTLMQLHGRESRRTAAALYPDAIVARQIKGAASLSALAQYHAFAYLLDGRGAAGRTGRAKLGLEPAGSIALPRPRVMIAGGLRPDNVGAVIRQACPYGVDVSSGVEVSPGCKDRAAMERFVRNVREVEDNGCA